MFLIFGCKGVAALWSTCGTRRESWGAHGFVTTGSWSRAEGSQALTVTLYRGKQLLQLLPLEDGTYAVQHDGAIRVRAWSMTGLRLRLAGQACLAR